MDNQPTSTYGQPTTHQQATYGPPPLAAYGQPPMAQYGTGVPPQLMYRELKHRGFDMALGWNGNMARQNQGVAMPPFVPAETLSTKLLDCIDKVLDQPPLPSHPSAILAILPVRILIDIDSSSELLKGLHVQHLHDHLEINTMDFYKFHNVIGIALVAIINRQLPFEYTIASKSTDVMVPIPPAPAADSAANVLAEWNAVYDAHNKELKSMFEKQARVERFDLIQTFHACKLEDGKPVGAYVLKMKDYVEQLERLGYVLPQDLSVGLILNGLTSDFAGFVRNYNKHNMGKTIGELHALLIEYE
ncbi:hypothetical protein Tco_1484287 [Tanacetum coccineum]